MEFDDVLQWLGILVIAIPFVSFYFLVIVLAAIQRSFGVTEIYIKILLVIFEWGKQRVRLHEEENDRNSSSSGLFPDGSDIPSENGDDHHRHRHLYHSVSSENVTSASEDGTIDSERSLKEMEHGFKLTDAMFFCKHGMEVIVEDTITQRFDAAELPSWNLLTRTNTSHEFISWRLTFLWIIGCILRLFILFPFRVGVWCFGIMMLIIGTFLIGRLPDGRMKSKANYWLTITCYRVISRAFSAVVRFHNRENRARGGGICVANHTSPIDIVILGCDNCYAMVGQEQGGMMGALQRAMLRSEHHIWFQRSESKDRHAVLNRLREHTDDKNKLPVLIFPEGTCINNTSIMMFKKGSFEVGGTIYPVAIKYDPRFADPFWNSSSQTLSRHMVNILTSWALVCDVWYLPPEHQRERIQEGNPAMPPLHSDPPPISFQEAVNQRNGNRKPNESVIEFTKRVKAEIARKGGLVDLDWLVGLLSTYSFSCKSAHRAPHLFHSFLSITNSLVSSQDVSKHPKDGQLKREKPKESLLLKQQEEYSKHIM